MEKYFVKNIGDKLMLCSRDIQVGDDVLMGNNHLTCAKPSSQINVDYVKNLGAIKIIGKISLEAIWVKEGDEFDEEEIKRDILTRWYAGEDDYTEFCHYHPKGNENFTISTDEEFIKEYPIKVKGPCGHFH